MRVLDEDAVEGHVLEHEDLVDESGRNPTPLKLDETATTRRTEVDKDKVEGKLKEWEGELTDDESREAEGRAQGELGDAKDKARETWEDVKDRVGREYNERADDDEDDK